MSSPSVPARGWPPRCTSSFVTLRLAAVLAHPDDESRLVGGTLARAAVDGAAVSLYCATRGEAGDAGRSPSETAALREGELQAACAALGIGELWLDNFADGGLADVDADTVTARIVRFVRTTRAHAVITFGPDGRTGHPDHVAVGRRAEAAFAAAGDAACWPDHLREGLSAWQPHWLYHSALADSVARRAGWSRPAAPDAELVAVDVSSVLARKQKAVVECHASQWALSPFDLTHGWEPWSVEHFRLARTAPTARGGDPLAQLDAGVGGSDALPGDRA